MQNVITITNNFILSNGIKELPLDFDGLVKICNTLGYKVFSYSQAKDAIIAMDAEKYMEYKAFARRVNSSQYVFFDDALSVGLRNFAIAHEIGHIALNHNYNGNVGYTQADTVHEREANTFAYQLLAPLCVLRAMNIVDLADIQSSTLLDKSEAKVVHAALHHYKKQPRSDELIKAYGIRIPQKRFDFSTILILLTVLLLAFSMILRKLPTPQTLEETTSNFFEELKEKQLQTESTLPAEISETQNTIDQTETVYITRSGERYHKQNCYHIKSSTTVGGITLSKAIEEGYTPCKSCYE